MTKETEVFTIQMHTVAASDLWMCVGSDVMTVKSAHLAEWRFSLTSAEREAIKVSNMSVICNMYDRDHCAH